MQLKLLENRRLKLQFKYCMLFHEIWRNGSLFVSLVTLVNWLFIIDRLFHSYAYFTLKEAHVLQIQPQEVNVLSGWDGIGCTEGTCVATAQKIVQRLRKILAYIIWCYI